MAVKYSESVSFYSQLQFYYISNRGKIRRNYKDITRKFLDYNDKEKNPTAYLRKPQFEALEMYVFIKEFMNNAQVYTMFDDWSNRKDKFSDSSYYSILDGHISLLGFEQTEKQTAALFNQMKKVSESYPNYIYALTMGLGKTVLMATCIFYEFLLSYKYPKDTRFCHNALVFAPDKTVLQSLKEIVTLDKSLIVPEEYARVLESNIKIHFLDDAGTTLNTLDNSKFNIVISNTQKIIVKHKKKEDSPADQFYKMSNLLTDLYEEDDLEDDKDLMYNQRFQKLCRLSQIGVYVDEAHHMFGKELEKALRTNSAQTSLRNTINLLAEDLSSKGTNVVGCYNYTGTPYVNNKILPEVVYAYGLKESIGNGYLKEVDVTGYENVKNEEFLSGVIKDFWDKYGDKTYEGLQPKLAIFASKVEEANTEVKPIVEKILAELDIPLSKILVNVGDSSITSNNDIRDFYNLDVAGTEGSKKQFIILVEKGREGWNCRSLFGVALYRNPKSKVFVLQATMRCLRKITDEQQKASVYLSKSNLDTLNDELNKNFNIDIKDLGNTSSRKKESYEVRVLPPPRYITVKQIRHKYSIIEKSYTSPVNFELTDMDIDKYKAIIYEKIGITNNMSIKQREADNLKDNVKYSIYSLSAEISRYLNISPILISRILRESKDGTETILEYINKYNDILYDVIVPKIFNLLFNVSCERITEDKKLTLLREPKGTDKDYYVFKGFPELVTTNSDENLKNLAHKSFHADTYCFDSRPELECFLQYITNSKVKEIYFTGMFTSNQGDLSIQYYDPESRRIRHYYPDFLALMEDGSYRLIEVKGDNKINDVIVKAKAEAAREVAVESDMEYIIYAGSALMSSNVLEDKPADYQQATMYE